MSHHLIVADNLEFAYPDGTKALRGLSFTIRHGEAVGVVGANGAGKSTLLLQMVGALLPTGGTLNIGGYPLGKRTLPQIRRSVGMIFQRRARSAGQKAADRDPPGVRAHQDHRHARS